VLNSTSLGDFTGKITFTSPTTYISGTTTTTTATPTPTDTPTPTPTEAPTDTPTDTPTSTDDAQGLGVDVPPAQTGGSGSPGGSGGLAATGVNDITELAVIGSWLVVVGSLLVLVTRRRPGTHAGARR
jgi:hypothetical protein